AFEWFARIGIDVGVIEVGLGGRLDATNLVHPAGTAITSIGIDHVEYLGSDVGTIAGEKAGILKPDVPLALGAVPPEAETVILGRARAVGAPAARIGVEAAFAERPDGLAFLGPGVEWDGLRLALPGRFQRDNAAVALLLLALLRDRFRCPLDAIRRGLATVRWPGRLAVVGSDPLVVLDGAHNPRAAAALGPALEEVFGDLRRVFVVSVFEDKDVGGVLSALAPYASHTIFTASSSPRSAPPERLAEIAASLGHACQVVEPLAEAIETGRRLAGPEGMVVVTGSLFMVGEARTLLVGPLE
ncbi:MAG TPA: cyanophycin synthetase, partial [Actinomycetota bacterium]|nr:cyanophycin synthetase [Actinomycetota bacterium]